MTNVREQIKNWLRWSYCHATLPYRTWQNRQLFAAGRAPVLVLFYHRVANDATTPWTHSTRQFERQMRWLQARFDMVSLEEAQRRIRSRSNARPAVHITFDDGYADNFDHALPLLICEQIPCTYFVSTRFVFSGEPFPHDWALKRPCRPNSIDQLHELATAGIEIGAHTRNHVDLGSVNDPVRLYDEVVSAGEELQQALGRPVRYFSFPFGLLENLNPAAFALAHEHGFEAVCSAYGDYNHPGGDPFHIRRIHADNMTLLKNWATLDPRKLNNPVPYDYGASIPHRSSSRSHDPSRT